MKKRILLLLSVFWVAISCSSSDDAGQSFVSDIMVGDRQFTPTSIIVEDTSTATDGGLTFTLTREDNNESESETMIVSIEYPLNSTVAPDGVYQFDIGPIFDTLFANGSYFKGTEILSLAGYFVEVTTLPDNKYRLDFQNIQAVDINTGDIKIISGYCEGRFN